MDATFAMAILTHHTTSLTDILAVLACLGLVSSFYVYSLIRRRSRTTKLLGPPSTSFFFGLSRETFASSEQSSLFEEWEDRYGSVYQLPFILGTKQVVLLDPKAISHFFANDTLVYRQTDMANKLVELFFGRNLMWAEAGHHKRQRKSLAPAFSNAAIRGLMPVFYDSAYSLKAAWDSKYQSTSAQEGIVFDVQTWMNYVSLDTIGIGGFGHDFGSLKGKPSPIVDAFDSFGHVQHNFFHMFVFLFAQAFPLLVRLPNQRHTIFQNIGACVAAIADDLMAKARAEKEADGAGVDKSIIGALVRSENAGSMSYDEIVSQYLLIIAGYETTSYSITWALIELSRNQKEQEALRAELMQFSNGDPSWEQVTNSLPYLDAVVCETLRMHPPGAETIRQAYQDDVIPLSKPVYDAKGKLIDHVVIAKDTIVRIPIMALNRSELLWGKDAKEFKPSRWIDGGQNAAEIQGYRHLLTFGEGPRMCLGRPFALMEFKAVLSVLIRNYTFELPDGPSTKIETHKSFLDRPKVAGQPGPNVPLMVRRVDQ